MVFFCWLKMSNQFQSFGCHIDDYSTKKKLKTEKSNNIKQTTTNKQIHITSHKLNIWFFIFTIFQCWREKNEFHNQWHIHSVMVEWFFDIYFFRFFFDLENLCWKQQQQRKTKTNFVVDRKIDLIWWAIQTDR